MSATGPTLIVYIEPASVPPVRSKRLFETAVRDHYSKVLGSATLCSEPLYSALLCSVHVYARVHTSIYILAWTCAYPCTECLGTHEAATLKL